MQETSKFQYRGDVARNQEKNLRIYNTGIIPKDRLPSDGCQGSKESEPFASLRGRFPGFIHENHGYLVFEALGYNDFDIVV